MSGVSSDLSLDTSEAFSALDELDARFADVVAGFGAGLADALSSVTGAAVDVPVEADTTAAQDAISGLEADPVLVEVEVDAEQAQTSIDQTQDSLGGLSTTAQQAGGSLDSAGSAATAFGVSAGIARGNASGLLGPLQRLGPGGVAAAGGIGAAVAVTGELFTIGVRATSALQRFELILGESAGAVDRIDIGGLNTDIAGLASASASGGAGLRNAAADFFQFAETGGLAASQAEETTQQILVLAARASVLNPALGEAGDASAKLQRALATGGRFASQFGLSLDSVSIKAEAARLGLEGADGELSRAALVAGGASLAMQQVGDTLAGDIAAGSENAAVQLRSVGVELRSAAAAAGKPLVAPILDLLREASPFAVEFGVAFGELASASIPLLTATLAVLTPVLSSFGRGVEGITAGLGAIPTPVLAVAAAFGVLVVGARAALTAMLLLSAANPVTLALVGAATAVTVLGAALGLLDDDASGVEGSLTGTREGLDAATQSAQSLAQILNESGRATFVEEVLNRITEISPEVVGALNDTGLSVSDLVSTIRSGMSVSADGELFDQLVTGAGLTGDAAEEARGQLGELAYQISISANAASQLDEAQRRNTEAAGSAAENLQDEADAASELSDQASELADNLDAIFGAQQSVAEGAISVRDDQRAALEAFVALNGQYVAGSESGDAFLSTLQNLGGGIRDQTIALLSTEDGARAANLAQAGYTAGLRQLARAAGLSQSEIRQLVRDFASVPVPADEATSAVARLDRAARHVPNSVRITIYTNALSVAHDFDVLKGSISNAGAAAAGGLFDFHGTPGNPSGAPGNESFRVRASGATGTGAGTTTIVDATSTLVLQGDVPERTVTRVESALADHRRKLSVLTAMR